MVNLKQSPQSHQALENMVGWVTEYRMIKCNVALIRKVKGDEQIFEDILIEYF
jgi:hypothetical protein